MPAIFIDTSAQKEKIGTTFRVRMATENSAKMEMLTGEGSMDEGRGQEAFFSLLGSRDEELQKKVRGLLKLLKDAIGRDQSSFRAKGFVAKEKNRQGEKRCRDGALST